MGDDVFDASWLALREPADHRARAEELAGLLVEESGRRGWSRALDLGSGTGSNVRYLRPRLAETGAWSWTLVDHDPALLARARFDPASPGSIRTVVGNLGDVGLELVGDTDVVTASALLDLVSERWLAAAVERCLEVDAGVLFALTYDGSITWSDPDPLDDVVREALNAHQVRDKGFGPALGPDANDVAASLLDVAGYRTWTRESPWLLHGPRDADLADALLAGWVDACTQMSPESSTELLRWAERRASAIRSGAVTLRVGHRDLLALPRP